MGRQVLRKHVTPEGLKDCTAQTPESCTAKGFDGAEGSAQHFELGQEEQAQRVWETEMEKRSERETMSKASVHKKPMDEDQTTEAANPLSATGESTPVEEEAVITDAEIEKLGFAYSSNAWRKQNAARNKAKALSKRPDTFSITISAVDEGAWVTGTAAMVVKKDGSFEVVSLGSGQPLGGRVSFDDKKPNGGSISLDRFYDRHGLITYERLSIPDENIDTSTFRSEGDRSRVVKFHNRGGDAVTEYYAASDENRDLTQQDEGQQLIGRWDSENGWTEYNDEAMVKLYQDFKNQNEKRQEQLEMNDNDFPIHKKMDDNYYYWRRENEAFLNRLNGLPDTSRRARVEAEAEHLARRNRGVMGALRRTFGAS